MSLKGFYNIDCMEGIGFEYIGFEIDKDYYEAANKRLVDFRKQPKLDFVKPQQPTQLSI